MAEILARLEDGRPPLRATELAEMLGCARSWVNKLIKADAIRAGRIGRNYRIPVSEARRLAREAGLLS